MMKPIPGIAGFLAFSSSSSSCSSTSTTTNPVDYFSGHNNELTIEHRCDWTLPDNSVCSLLFNGNHFEMYCSHVAEHAKLDSKQAHVCKWANCGRTGREFKAFYMLIAHLRTHTGERPHACQFHGCKATYRRLENLKTHVRQHTGEKPFICQMDGCSSAFTNTSDRAKHEKRTHSDKKPFACQMPACHKAYTDPSSRRKHMQNCHPLEYDRHVKMRSMMQSSKQRANHQAVNFKHNNLYDNEFDKYLMVADAESNVHLENPSSTVQEQYNYPDWGTHNEGDVAHIK